MAANWRFWVEQAFVIACAIAFGLSLGLVILAWYLPSG